MRLTTSLLLRPCTRLPIFLLILLLLLLHLPGRSQPRSQEVLQIKSEAVASTNGYLQRLRDPNGLMDAHAAMASAGWQHLPASLSAGYSSDTLWLRITVQKDGAGPNHWFLNLGNALLDDARLYQYGANGRWEQVAHSGDGIPHHLWPVDARIPLMPFNISSNSPEKLLIRIKTKNSISLNVEIFPSELQIEKSGKENFYYGIGFGFCLAIIIFHLLFFTKAKNQISGWYVSYISCLLLAECLNAGLLQLLFRLPGWFSDHLLWFAMCAGLPVTTVFSSLQLGMQENSPVLQRRIVGTSFAIAIISSLFIISGNIAQGMLLLQSAALLGIILMMSIAVYRIPQDRNKSYKFIMIFSIYYAGVAIAFLRNFGILPNNSITMNSVALGALVHMTVMSFRLINSYEKLTKDKEAVQRKILQMVSEQNEILEREVNLRTEILQQEIRRREILEKDLRNAINMEHQTKKSQLDFLSMVSHEFRTPLAIINTTAQQIARNLDASREKMLVRCTNLRNAVKRMQALIDEYLDSERLQMDSEKLQSQIIKEKEIIKLIDDVAKDWPPERIEIENSAIPPFLSCDTGLFVIALRNLLSNADKHAPAETKITIQTSVDHEKSFEIRIINHGQEIPQEDIPYLFEKFFRGRLSKKSPGAGLGLYIVKKIAEMHHGTIHLEKSGKDGMICFCMQFPLQKFTSGSHF